MQFTKKSILTPRFCICLFFMFFKMFSMYIFDILCSSNFINFRFEIFQISSNWLFLKANFFPLFILLILHIYEWNAYLKLIRLLRITCFTRKNNDGIHTLVTCKILTFNKLATFTNFYKIAHIFLRKLSLQIFVNFLTKHHLRNEMRIK